MRFNEKCHIRLMEMCGLGLEGRKKRVMTTWRRRQSSGKFISVPGFEKIAKNLSVILNAHSQEGDTIVEWSTVSEEASVSKI